MSLIQLHKNLIRRATMRVPELFRKIAYRIRYRRRGTIRTMFSLFAVLTLLSANVINSNSVSYIRLAADQTMIEAGKRFSLDVYAFAHVPVNAVDVTLRFDPDSVEVIGVNRGQSVLTIWTEDPVVTQDQVTLRGGTFQKGFLGEHKIATIDLVAKKSGQSEFFAANVTLLAGDGRGTPVRTADSNTSKVNVFVYDENKSPSDIGVNITIAIVTDIDGDGRVTLRDISVFMAAWSRHDRVFDFDGDGRMTFKDFSIILADAFLKR